VKNDRAGIDRERAAPKIPGKTPPVSGDRLKPATVRRLFMTAGTIISQIGTAINAY